MIRKLKVKFIRLLQLVRCVLLYGAEVWEMKKKEEMLETTEIKNTAKS